MREGKGEGRRWSVMFYDCWDGESMALKMVNNDLGVDVKTACTERYIIFFPSPKETQDPIEKDKNTLAMHDRVPVPRISYTYRHA